SPLSATGRAGPSRLRPRHRRRATCRACGRTAAPGTPTGSAIHAPTCCTTGTRAIPEMPSLPTLIALVTCASVDQNPGDGHDDGHCEHDKENGHRQLHPTFTFPIAR